MDAGTLHCPECGAVVTADSTQCKYCKALLETIACPKCMGMMFKGTKFCPHCGANTEMLGQGPNTTRHCPRCKTTLADVEIANTPLEECTHCGGLWISVASFDRICSNAEAREAASGLQLPPPVEIDPLVHYLNCPQCNKLMNRMNYASRSGIIMDVCRPHGIWLDRDEIRRIVEYIQSGGLERARRAEKEELEEERRNATFLPVDTGGPVHFGSLNDALDSDERVHLLRGIASMANHFLGEDGINP